MKKAIVALCAALSACTASCQNHDLTGAGAIPTDLSASSSVYVALPADGAYESKVDSRSGRTTTQAIAAAFARHGLRRDDCRRIRDLASGSARHRVVRPPEPHVDLAGDDRRAERHRRK